MQKQKEDRKDSEEELLKQLQTEILFCESISKFKRTAYEAVAVEDTRWPIYSGRIYSFLYSTELIKPPGI